MEIEILKKNDQIHQLTHRLSAGLSEQEKLIQMLLTQLNPKQQINT